VDAVHRAYVAIGKIVQKQAFILAFSDTFYVPGVALIVALLAGLALKRSDNFDGGSPQLEIYNQPRGGG
jgi:DHA2 family multidrug resistance protein